MRIEGAVVAIGNAPTALFHLLERLDAGWPRPALILAFPVGLGLGLVLARLAIGANGPSPEGVVFPTRLSTAMPGGRKALPATEPSSAVSRT